MPSSTTTGRAGEFFASFVLETHGVEVHHVDRQGADLWCRVGGSIVAVEVKTATSPEKNRGNRVASYKYHTKGIGAEWCCFVALDRQLVLMRRTSEITTESIRLPASLFNEATQRRTIEEFLAT